jgi:hypothetical protein
MTKEIFQALAAMAKQVAIDSSIPCRVKELDTFDSEFMQSALRVQVSCSNITTKPLPGETAVEATVSASILSRFDASPLAIFAAASNFERAFAKPMWVLNECLYSDGVEVTHEVAGGVKMTLVQAKFRGVI